MEFQIIQFCCCFVWFFYFVFMRTHFEIPCWAITCAYRCLFILYRSSCHNYFVWAYEYVYERIKSILYPPSSRFLNKFLFLLEKLLKKWKYFYDSWGNWGMWHENLWELILEIGFWRTFNGFLRFEI